jgi:hypothetical protein
MRRRACALAALAVCGAWPANAAGDVTATDGVNVVRAGVQPRVAGRSLALRVRTDLARVDGARPLGFTGIRFGLPAGARFDPAAVPRCRERVLAPGGAVDPARCPRGSRIGSGLVYADARPILPERVAADVQLINGIAETGNDGRPFPSPRPAIFLAAEALGVQVLFAATFESGGRRVLVALGDTVQSPAPFTITGLDLRIRRAGTARRPFLRAPSACRGTWTFSVAFLFQAPLRAREAVPCRAPARARG